jgi:uncharacterized membrane protein
MFLTSHLHPMLVHFPIALVALGFLAEVVSFFVKKEICLNKMSLYLLLTGTLAAAATWLSGVLFTSEMSGVAGEIKETHETFALITLTLLVITSVIRLYLLKKENQLLLKKIAFITYALAAICVAITGFFGGTLVYTYMMPL